MKMNDLEPQVRLVYDELVAIRRNGLGYETMHDHGANIRQLECVSAELRKPPPQRDRTTAAIDAVTCAVARLPRVRHRTYLHYLLLAPEKSRNSWSVLSRQMAAERALGSDESMFNRNKSVEIMKSAHIELAALLVRLRESPCEVHAGGAQVSELRRIYEEALTEAETALQRISRLCQLGIESSPAARRELERIIERAFPNGAARATPHRSQSVADFLIESAVTVLDYWDLAFVEGSSSANRLGEFIFLESLGVRSGSFQAVDRKAIRPVALEARHNPEWWLAIATLEDEMRNQERVNWPILD